MASSAAQVHQRWMAYERFAKLHATAIDPGFAGGVGAAVAYRQRVMVTAAEVLFSTASPTAQWCVPSLTLVCTPHTPTPLPQVLHCQTQLEGGGNGNSNTGWLPNPWRRVVAYFRLIEAREQFKCACRARPHARPPLRAFLAASCRIARLTTAAAVAPCVCVCRAVPSILGAAQVHAAARSLRPYPAQRRRP